MQLANFGVTWAKPQRERKSMATARRRKTTKQKTVARVRVELPSQVEQPATEQPKESGGLLANLRKKVLGSPSESQPESPKQSESSLAGSSAALDAETLARLASVQDVAGDDVSGSSLPPTVIGEAGDLPPAADAPTVFKVKFIQGRVVSAFEMAAKFRRKTLWRVDDDDANSIAEPMTELANSLWPKLKALLPEMIAARCEALPGLLETLMAIAMVAGPKMAADFATKPDISEETTKAKLTEVSQSTGAPGRVEVPKTVAEKAVDNVLGVPTASGTIGG